MKLRKILALTCAASMTASLLLTGCGSSASETTAAAEEAAAAEAADDTEAAADSETAAGAVNTDAVLTIASPQCSATLDPVNGYDYWYLVRYGVCETLMGFNEDMTPYCWLAESYEMEDDQLTWHFTIRDDVTFSNGNPLTAEIAKSCIEKAFAESNTAATYFSYDSMEADGQVLTIVTSTPTPTLAYTLADPVFVMYDTTQDLTNCADEGVIGTGPFVVSAFDSVTGNTSVVRNDNYWNGDVQCAGINFTIVKDTTAMGLQMVTGEVDAAYSVAYTDIDQFTNNDQYHVLTVASGRTDYVFLNENSVFDDIALRQAVTRALDTETYCNSLLAGQYVVGKTPLTSALPYGYDELTYNDAYDMEGSMALLDEAGYVDTDGDGYRETPEGEPLEINLVYYNSRAEIPVMAEAMQLNLASVGINVVLNEIDQGSAWNTFTAGEYDMLMMSISMTSSGDPQTSLNSYFTTNSEENANYNHYGYSNADVDALMDQLKVEFDLDKRQELVKELEQYVMDDCAIISLCYPMLNFVTTSNVSGITSHASDYYWVSADTCMTE